MKKFTRITKLFSSLAVAVLGSGMMMLAPMKVSALSIPYNGDATPPAPYPAFNVFTGTPFSGDESDFLRGKVAGDPGDSKNVVDTACQDGTRFTLRVYVHNGASQDLNGDGNGPSVAHNVVLKVGGVTSANTSNFTPNATLTASNAASVSDDMHINCTDGGQYTMSYVQNSAKQYSIPGGSQAVSNSVVTTGAPIGTMHPDGNVWGCWDQRVYVTLDVVVKKQTPPVVSTGECKLVDVTADASKRSVTAHVTGTVDNATIVGYEINWGDNSPVSHKQNDTHVYAKDGTYVIVTKVQVKFADGHTEWKTATACAKQVTFKGNTPVVPVTPVTPPVTPGTGGPTTLVNTGPGSIAGIFAATSIAGAMAYRVFMARRLSRQ